MNQRILHDLDYFLLRYGTEDVGKYTKDGSVVSKYYGVLVVCGATPFEIENAEDIESVEKSIEPDMDYQSIEDEVYDNGYIKEEASHNHGRSSLDDFWPYSLLIYNGQVDRYECIANIDAWQYQILEDIDPDPEFPKEKDLDGDGIVYYDISENYYEPTLIMDNAEYDAWCEQYNKGNTKEIIWYSIISEEKYNEMFPS